MIDAPTLTKPASQARKALRAAFVARLIRRMQRVGVLSAIFRATFSLRVVANASPSHPRASGVRANLKPLRRSGVAAGGAGGGGPGQNGATRPAIHAATGLPAAA